LQEWLAASRQSVSEKTALAEVVKNLDILVIPGRLDETKAVAALTLGTRSDFAADAQMPKNEDRATAKACDPVGEACANGALYKRRFLGGTHAVRHFGWVRVTERTH
jgi:hypothetical protein